MGAVRSRVALLQASRSRTGGLDGRHCGGAC
jgi:hypothetical protein